MNPSRRTWAKLVGVGLVLGLGCGVGGSIAQARPQAPARQVVVIGVLATPGSTAMDPKIAPAVAAQLRRTLPNHGFKLIGIKSDRVTAGGGVGLDLGNGFAASVGLLNAADSNNRVQMRFELTEGGASQFQTIVTTPPDQFNFMDKMLPNNDRILIGVGAR